MFNRQINLQLRNAGIAALSVILFGSCSQKTFYREEVKNPEYKKNTAFKSYENLSLGKFDSLRIKYQTDTIFHGEQDEFKRILLLRNWIKSKIAINDFCEKYPGEGYPEGILDNALKGQGYHCGHYMVVQNALMNAYGFITRCLGSGPGVKGGPDGHHGINEIWVNKYQKWFLSDAKYNHHFEKNGIPLSALEIRDEFLKNKAADIVMVQGPDRKPIEYDEVADNKGVFRKQTKEAHAQWYTWIEWDQFNDRYSAWPKFDGKLNMFQDEYFKNHTWIWDGKPHWAYNTEHVNYVTSRDAIEWTPNTIEADVDIKGNTADIKLSSSTPNLKEYQVKQSSNDEWVKTDSLVTVRLNNDRNEFLFRSVNKAEIAGPEYRVVVAVKKS